MQVHISTPNFKEVLVPTMSNDDPGRSQRVSSLAELMKEFDKGIMKTPLIFEGQIHEACPPMSELVDDKRKRIDRFWNDTYLKTLNTTTSHIQDWFTKISFINKTAFVRKLIQVMADSKKLFDVAYFIGPPLKDMVYARTQFTRSAYDVAAIDHNRSVEDPLYESQSSYYIEWFQSLNPQEQFNVIIGLAHLGGGALQECIYLDVAKILEEKDKNLIRQRVLEYLAFKRKESYNVLASKVANRKKRGHRSHPMRKHVKEEKLQSKEIVEEEEESDYVVLLRNKIEVFKNALKTMNDIADENYTDPAKGDQKEKAKGQKARRDRKRRRSSSVGNGKTTKKKNFRKLNAGLDRMQMLPLWDNRRITAFLPDKTLSTIVNVNKYWKDMVEKTRKEMKVRKKIDKYLKPSESHATALKGVGTKGDRKSKKISKKPEVAKDTKSLSKRSHEMDDVFTPEDFQDHLNVAKVFTGPSPKLSPYSKPYNEFVVCDKYCDDRAFDATKRWAAYSCKMDVEFANIVVGANCNLRLEDAHKAKISCLCFHPEGVLIFTGGYDGMVKLHDIWKKAMKLVYPGHRGVVEDISANCRYVASCGLDNQIRVFNISDGRCMFCYILDKHTPCSLVLTQCRDPILYVGNTSGELIMFRIRSEDDSKQVGRTVYAHHGEVTSLHHYPCVLLSTGIDGYVRMWTTHFGTPYWIVSLLHPTRVNSAILSYRKIISACEDGKIRIWDVMKSVCERVILVVKNCRPVLDIVCINTPSTVKLVLSNEADIKVLEFPLKKIPKKKIGRFTGSLLKPVADLKAKMTAFEPPISSLDKRMMKLQMRQAVLPPLRPSPHKKSPTHPLLIETTSVNGQSPTDLHVWSSKTITKN